MEHHALSNATLTIRQGLASQPRVRIIIPARLAPTAIARNSIRRRIREAVRQTLGTNGKRLVIVVRGTPTPRSDELKHLLVNSAKKFGTVSP